MAAVPSQFEGQLTDRYAGIIDPTPEERTIRDLLPFVSDAQKSGKDYVYPIVMSDEMGITYDNSGDAATLNPAISMVTKEARLSAPDKTVVAELPYSMQLRMQNGASESGSAPSYFNDWDGKVMSMLRGLGNWVELSLLHGCGSGSTALDDCGVVHTTPVAVGSGTTYATATVQFTAASYIKDLWDNVQNSMWDVLNSAGTSIVATGVKIVSIADHTKCQVVVSCATGSSGVTVASGHRFVPMGSYQNDCVGLAGQVKNQSATFANISAGTYSKHRGTLFNVGGALTRAKLFQAIASLPSTPSGRRQLVALASPFTFADLAEETHAQVHYDTQTGKAIESKEVGTAELQYIAPKAVVRVICTDFQKQGQCIVIDPSVGVRLGGSDITMRGIDGANSITLHLPTKTAFQMRGLSQQAPLLKQMNVNIALTGIANTGGFAPA